MREIGVMPEAFGVTRIRVLAVEADRTEADATLIARLESGGTNPSAVR